MPNIAVGCQLADILFWRLDAQCWSRRGPSSPVLCMCRAPCIMGLSRVLHQTPLTTTPTAMQLLTCSRQRHPLSHLPCPVLRTRSTSLPGPMQARPMQVCSLHLSYTSVPLPLRQDGIKIKSPASSTVCHCSTDISHAACFQNQSIHADLWTWYLV